MPAPKKDAPSRAPLEEVIRATENAPIVQAARDALQAVRGMRAFLGEKVGYERAPNLQPLDDMLKAVVHLCDSAVGVGEVSISNVPEALVNWKRILSKAR